MGHPEFPDDPTHDQLSDDEKARLGELSRYARAEAKKIIDHEIQVGNDRTIGEGIYVVQTLATTLLVNVALNVFRLRKEEAGESVDYEKVDVQDAILRSVLAQTSQDFIDEVGHYLAAARRKQMRIAHLHATVKAD